VDYQIDVVSDSDRTFTLTRDGTTGGKTRTCDPDGGGCVGGNW